MTVACVSQKAQAAEEWQSAGTAIFMDGWLHPGMSLDQTQEVFQYEVPLEKNIYRDGVYRLVDPYHKGAPALYNDATNVGYIVFDVSDPDHVLFEAVDAGFANYFPMQIYQLYCINSAAYYMNRLGCTLSDLIANYGDQIPWTTFKDGVVSLGHIVRSNGEIEYDACYGTQNNPFAGYCWEDKYGDPVNMDTTITFVSDSGVDSPEYIEEEGMVRYYNLQGEEVANPEKGIYIEVGKNKSKKVIF